MTPADALAFVGRMIGAFIERAFFTVDGWWLIPAAIAGLVFVATAFQMFFEHLERTPEERRRRREYERRMLADTEPVDQMMKRIAREGEAKEAARRESRRKETEELLALTKAS